MSKNTVKNPNSNGRTQFIVILVILVVVFSVGIGYLMVNKSNQPESRWKLSNSVPNDLQVTLVENGTNPKGEPSGTYVQFSKEGVDLKESDVIELFEDFQCPYCVKMQQAVGKDIESAVENGKVLQYFPMTYLDEKRGSTYSSEVAFAVETLARLGEADPAWKLYHSAWDNHPDETGGYITKEEIGDIMEIVGASDDAVKKFNEGDIESAKKINDVDFAYLSQVLGGENVGVPTMLINGELQEDVDAMVQNLNK